MMAELPFWFQHCGRRYLPNRGGSGYSLSTGRGETYLPHTAKFSYNPHAHRFEGEAQLLSDLLIAAALRDQCQEWGSAFCSWGTTLGVMASMSAVWERGWGSRARTQVPPRVSGSMVHVPPSSSARSRIERRPTPTPRDEGSPHPSSWMERESQPVVSSRVRRRSQWRACAWRTTLVR